MDILHAPWREQYLTDTIKTECIFCDLTQQSEADYSKHFILQRNSYSFIALNKYPYNAGHLLIIPNAHNATLDALDNETQQELMTSITKSCALLKKALSCHGINVGINIEKAAGASITDHLHIHIVPRWHGDTNFLPIIGDTKQISRTMEIIYQTLKSHL